MLRGCLHCCPRCDGDVFLEDDPMAGSFLVCLQCGHTLTDAEERALVDRRRGATSVA